MNLDFFEILITHSDYSTGGNYSCLDWFDFQPELEEVKIVWTEDSWMLNDDKKDRLVFKEELEKRGFLVTLGENY